MARHDDWCKGVGMVYAAVQAVLYLLDPAMTLQRAEPVLDVK